MKAARIGVGHLEATALLGVDVQHDRLLAVAQLLQDADELAQVMAVVRTNIIQPERREEGGGAAGRERAKRALLQRRRAIARRRPDLVEKLGQPPG